MDLSWVPRTYFVFFYLGEQSDVREDGRTVARQEIIEGAHAGGYVVWCRM